MAPRYDAPLADRLPAPGACSPDELLTLFLGYVREKNLELYPAQEEALLELFDGKNVILNTPTGSGKSLVATAMCFLALAQGARAFYTCPIKALVSEKFFALCKDFGPDYVGMLTGDASVNRDAPIICCTAEILSNMALREGPNADVGWVVMDEFHYYADRERGVAWQVPLLTLPQAKFLLMSATLGPTELFEERITALNGAPTVTVRSSERPVPLDFVYKEIPLHETILELVREEKYPIYVVCFTQRSAAEEAQNLMSTDYSTKEEKKAIAAAIEGFRFDSPYGKDVQKFVRHGVGLHHAGLLPKYRLLVEKLAQRGHLKIICGTDTLGVGVNIPIRTVLFTKLCKFDGEKTAILSVRDFQQISGRAGRRGFDVAGTVVVQAPEHVIENLRMEQRAASDPAKRRKLVKKKPPEKGYVHWDKSTFDRLVASSPEPLVSRFQVSHGMILNMLQRGRGGCKAIARLIRNSHERRATKRALGRTAAAMFRSLVDAQVVEIRDGVPLVHADLQDDFSLNQALSLYLLETIPLLDREADTYALDLLTLVESILEDPEIILAKQLDRLKAEKLAELKMAGVEYEDRIAELEKLEYPKPNRDFIYDTFNAFAKKHPWVGQENIRPKSIAREMVEKYLSFAEYVKEYDLQRAEGLLLRYLSDVYKALVQTVPAPDKTDEVRELEVFFGAMVRAVDSSLLDEWERMRQGGDALLARAVRDERPEEGLGAADVTRDPRGFTVLVRNAAFALLRALARKDYVAAAAAIDAEAGGWTPLRLDEAMRAYWDEHTELRVDPAARAPAYTKIDAGDDAWTVEQSFVDQEGPTGWVARCTVDLARSRKEGRAVLELVHLGA